MSLHEVPHFFADTDLNDDIFHSLEASAPIATASRSDWTDNEEFTLEIDPARTQRNCRYALHITADTQSQEPDLTLWLHRGANRVEGHISAWYRGEHQGEFGLLATILVAEPIADSPVPIAILYSPVTQCNLNCIHCISRETRDRKSILAASIKDQIRDWCKRGLVAKIATDYSGDILWADKRFGGEIDFLQSLDVPFHIDTNGVHLDAEMTDRLVRSHLQSLNISLDAATSDTFQRVRKGAPPLESVIDQITYFWETETCGMSCRLGICGHHGQW